MSKIKKEQNIMFSPFFDCYKLSVIISKRSKSDNEEKRIRQCKYLNNIVEQDHRFIKWSIQNGLGFKNLESGKRTLSGIEVVQILRKQISNPGITMFKSFFTLIIEMGFQNENRTAIIKVIGLCNFLEVTFPLPSSSYMFVN